MATDAEDSAPLSKRAVCRSTSEVRAVCGSSARTDLCGGWPARAIPTAIVLFILRGQGNLRRAAAGTQRGLQAQTLCRSLLPRRVAKPTPAQNRPPQCRQFRLRLRRLHAALPILRQQYRPLVQCRYAAVGTMPETRPPPLHRPFHKLRTQGVALHVMKLLGDHFVKNARRLTNECALRGVLYRCGPCHNDQHIKARALPKDGDTPAGTALRLFTAYTFPTVETRVPELRCACSRPTPPRAAAQMILRSRAYYIDEDTAQQKPGAKSREQNIRRRNYATRTGKSLEPRPSSAVQLPRRRKGRDFPDFDSQPGPGKEGQELPHLTGFGQAWPKLAKTGQNWTRLAKFGQGWPNLDNRWTGFPALVRHPEHPTERKAKNTRPVFGRFVRFWERPAAGRAGTKR